MTVFICAGIMMVRLLVACGILQLGHSAYHKTFIQCVCCDRIRIVFNLYVCCVPLHSGCNVKLNALSMQLVVGTANVP